MVGAIVGDVVGSVFERHGTKTTDFPLFRAESVFTDDTVLTVATAQAILDGVDYGDAYRAWGRRHPHRGYGGNFLRWLASDEPRPYHSFGNGSAMRVSPVGWAFDDLETVLSEAARSASVTHDHPEGVKGARAVAGCVFLARTGASRADLRRFLMGRIGYRLDRTLDEIRPAYRFDVTCQGSVPEALTAFLESESYEDAVRQAVALGGDADTQACIAGAVAEAFYGGVPERIGDEAFSRLTRDLSDEAKRFGAAYPVSGRGEGNRGSDR